MKYTLSTIAYGIPSDNIRVFDKCGKIKCLCLCVWRERESREKERERKRERG